MLCYGYLIHSGGKMITRNFFCYLLLLVVSSTLALYPVKGVALQREDDWAPIGLIELEKRLKRDLELINFPPRQLREPTKLHDGAPFYDVVIIGGGYSGMAASFALFKLGVTNIKIYDVRCEGLEGPWLNYARMKTLRSGKGVMGPALQVPNLTFHAWFEALYGREAWSKLYRTPTEEWMDYLRWYRKVLKLPIENQSALSLIVPEGDIFRLEINDCGEIHQVFARKVVLATGRDGFGGLEIPLFMNDVPKEFWAHSAERIDFAALVDKRIAVIGVGASGFDAAAVALENDAGSVTMIMRRSQLPNVNKFAEFSTHGFYQGFYHMSDEQRWNFLAEANEAGIPPPVEALERVMVHRNFYLCPDASVNGVIPKGKEVEIATSRGNFTFDYIILGTGFIVDGSKQPELKLIMDQILLWSDRGLPNYSKNKMGMSPYLGPHFEFMEKTSGSAPYLKNIYCFNYASFLSHGILVSDISGISTGATRLAEGIVADLFLQNADERYNQLKLFQETDFDESDFNFHKIKKG